MTAAKARSGKAVSARTRARRLAVQALYQWQLTGQSPGDIEIQFLEERLVSGDAQPVPAPFPAEPEAGVLAEPVRYRPGQTDLDYFHELLHGVSAGASELDSGYEPHLDRPPTQVDPVERTILRIGAYELSVRLEIPRKVVINEAVELAKMFGAEQSHRYINGVLDRLSQDLRPHG